MNEQRDDTTERDSPSPAGSDEQSRHSYYYDDTTGYEVYDPSKEDEDEEETDGPANSSGSERGEHGQ